jgi:phosphoribosylformylglycinamidine synthase subunit PurS
LFPQLNKAQTKGLFDMKAIVTVLPKPTVLDPQGAVVAQTLKQHLGVNGVEDVRVGRSITIKFNLKSTDKAQLSDKLNQICQEFLSNPVVEDYTLQIVEE